MWEMVNFTQIFMHTAIFKAAPSPVINLLIKILVIVSEFELIPDDWIKAFNPFVSENRPYTTINPRFGILGYDSFYITETLSQKCLSIYIFAVIVALYILIYPFRALHSV